MSPVLGLDGELLVGAEAVLAFLGQGQHGDPCLAGPSDRAHGRQRCQPDDRAHEQDHKEPCSSLVKPVLGGAGVDQDGGGGHVRAAHPPLRWEGKRQNLCPNLVVAQAAQLPVQAVAPVEAIVPCSPGEGVVAQTPGQDVVAVPAVAAEDALWFQKTLLYNQERFG